VLPIFTQSSHSRRLAFTTDFRAVMWVQAPGILIAVPVCSASRT